MKKITLLFFAAMLGMSIMAQTTYDWLNTAPDGNWKQGAAGARWSGGLYDNPPAGGGTILSFNNNTYPAMTNNVDDYSVHQLIFGEYATSPRTISGNPLKFWNNGGTNGKIENFSTAHHTISIEITTGATLELNPINGNLTFTNRIINNNWLDSWGNAGKTLFINGEITGTGGFTVKPNTKAVITANATYTGDTYVDANGTLELQANLPNSKVIVQGGGNLTVNAANSDLTFTSAITNNGWIDTKGQANKTLIISGVISGTGGLSVKGNSNAVFTANSTYSGKTYVESGGKLELQANLPNSEVEVQGGGNLILNTENGGFTLTNNIINGNWIDTKGQAGKTLIINGTISGTGGLSVKQNSEVVITANATHTNKTYVESGGKLELQANLPNSEVEVQGGGNLIINTENGGFTLTNNIINGNWIDTKGQAGKTLIINGAISGTGGLSVKQNSEVVIAANSTYSGDTYVESGGTLKLQANLPNSKVIVENGGTLIIDGTNATIKNLQIDNGGAVEVVAGKSFTVTGTATNNGTITVRSGATVVGGIEGNATVEQAAEEHRTYYIGSPVSTITAKSPNVGLHITFDEANDAWTATDAATAFPNNPTFGKGYGVQIAALGTSGTSTTISLTGTLNNGTQTIPLTVGGRKFNFLGNPYPSYLSGAEIAKDANLEKTVWTYFKDTDGNYKFGFFNLSEAGAGTLMADGNIPPMQGFWVKATAAGNFTFKNDLRIHKPAGSNVFRAPQVSERQELRLALSNGTVSDEAILLFSENANNDWNSSKMMNPGLNIYTVKAGSDLALNSRTAIEYDVETAVGVKAESGVYTFSASKFENFGAEKAFLLDKATGVSTDLSTGDYTVNFAEAYEGTDRFALVFPRSGVISGLEGAESAGFFAFANNNRITVSSDAQAGMIYVFNAVGQQVAAEAISGTLTTVNTALPAGIYMVKVNSLTTKVVVR